MVHTALVICIQVLEAVDDLLRESIVHWESISSQDLLKLWVVDAVK